MWRVLGPLAVLGAVACVATVVVSRGAGAPRPPVAGVVAVVGLAAGCAVYGVVTFVRLARDRPLLAHVHGLSPPALPTGVVLLAALWLPVALGDYEGKPEIDGDRYYVVDGRTHIEVPRERYEEAVVDHRRLQAAVTGAALVPGVVLGLCAWGVGREREVRRSSRGGRRRGPSGGPGPRR